MFDILPVLLCLGLLPAPDGSNCVLVSNTWGPYSTRSACEARAAEIKETWPTTWAAANEYFGPVMMGPVTCEPTGKSI